MANVFYVTFAGRRYYEFKGLNMKPGFPREIRSLGMGVDRIDAVVTWARNGKPYFFSGTQYWRFDAMGRRPDSGYPRPIEGNWRGIPNAPSAAFSNGEGKLLSKSNVFFYHVLILYVNG